MTFSRPEKLSNTPLTGTSQFLYKNSAIPNFVIWNGTNWVNSTIITSAADIINVFPLIKNRAVVTLTAKSNEFSGSIYTITGSIVDAWSSLALETSTTKLAYFSDTLQNFGRVSSNQLSWITLTTNDAFWKSEITLNNVDQVINVGFSQNKATILYGTNKISIYRHTGDGLFETIVLNKVLSGTGLDVASAASIEYEITFSCFCNGIKAFVCLSQSLNCVILNKAGASCLKSVSQNTWQ